MGGSETSGLRYGDRRKARLAVRWVEKEGRALIVFGELRDDRLVADMERCINLDAQFDELFPQLGALVASLCVPATVAQAEIAAGDEGVASVLPVLDPPTQTPMEERRSFEQEHPRPLGLRPGAMGTIAVSLTAAAVANGEWVEFSAQREASGFSLRTR